jgi:hypothetical protein
VTDSTAIADTIQLQFGGSRMAPIAIWSRNRNVKGLVVPPLR